MESSPIRRLRNVSTLFLKLGDAFGLYLCWDIARYSHLVDLPLIIHTQTNLAKCDRTQNPRRHACTFLYETLSDWRCLDLEKFLKSIG